jgi:hypothetical protein
MWLFSSMWGTADDYWRDLTRDPQADAWINEMVRLVSATVAAFVLGWLIRRHVEIGWRWR